MGSLIMKLIYAVITALLFMLSGCFDSDNDSQNNNLSSDVIYHEQMSTLLLTIQARQL